jgi:hypothetical protein
MAYLQGVQQQGIPVPPNGFPFRALSAKSGSGSDAHADSSDVPATAPTPAAWGLLFYLNAEQTHTIPVEPSWPEVRSLIQGRNRIASTAQAAQRTTTAPSLPLPALLRNPRECEFCFQAAECLAYHAATEAGDAQSSGVPALFTHLARGLRTPARRAYLKHWDHLLDMVSDLLSLSASGSYILYWLVPAPLSIILSLS